VPELADMSVPELCTVCTAVSLISRLGTCLGPVPADVAIWLTDLANTMAAEITRR
jgi:hypothetical protein